MKFSEIEIVKNSHAREIVRRAIKNKRAAHAYLLYGPEGSGKEAIALSIAQTFLCERMSGDDKTQSLFADEALYDWACGSCSNCKRIAEFTHPDVHIVFPHPSTASEKEQTEFLQTLASQPFFPPDFWENSFILINDIRQLKRSLSTTSYEGTGSIVLILNAHRFKKESANALLKILEEPPTGTYFILTAQSLESLLATIVSRCQPLPVGIPSKAQSAQFLQQHYRVDHERAMFLATIADGNLSQAIEMIEEDVEAKRKLAIEFLRMAFRFNKPVEQMEFLNKLAGENDRRELQGLLELCLLWVRDAYVMKACQNDNADRAFIINTDFADTLLELNKNLPYFDHENVLSELEYAIECLERNVQPWLVLIVLLHRIRHLARPAS